MSLKYEPVFARTYLTVRAPGGERGAVPPNGEHGGFTLESLWSAQVGNFEPRWFAQVGSTVLYRQIPVLLGDGARPCLRQPVVCSAAVFARTYLTFARTYLTFRANQRDSNLSHAQVGSAVLYRQMGREAVWIEAQCIAIDPVGSRSHPDRVEHVP